MKKTITFATNCWQADWQSVLQGGDLELMIKNSCYPFDEKILCISNVDDLDLVKLNAQKKVDEGVIDRYIVVSEMAKEVLAHFDIKEEDFKGGYNYSMSPLTAIYAGSSDFLLYYTEDVCIEHDRHSWVADSMDLLNKDSRVFVSNPLWNHSHDCAKSESDYETDDWYIGYGFSDQCFLVRRDEFFQDIYKERHPDEIRYPIYGGDGFEKRVNSYMRNHERYSATNKHVSYLHEDGVHEDESQRKKSWFKRLFS